MIGTEATWWHNFIGGSEVTVLVAGKPITGHGVIITDDSAKHDQYGRQLAGFSWRWFSKSLKIIEITPQA